MAKEGSSSKPFQTHVGFFHFERDLIGTKMIWNLTIVFPLWEKGEQEKEKDNQEKEKETQTQTENGEAERGRGRGTGGRGRGGGGGGGGSQRFGEKMQHWTAARNRGFSLSGKSQNDVDGWTHFVNASREVVAHPIHMRAAETNPPTHQHCLTNSVWGPGCSDNIISGFLFFP